MLDCIQCFCYLEDVIVATGAEEVCRNRTKNDCMSFNKLGAWTRDIKREAREREIGQIKLVVNQQSLLFFPVLGRKVVSTGGNAGLLQAFKHFWKTLRTEIEAGV